MPGLDGLTSPARSGRNRTYPSFSLARAPRSRPRRRAGAGRRRLRGEALQPARTGGARARPSCGAPARRAAAGPTRSIRAARSSSRTVGARVTARRGSSWSSPPRSSISWLSERATRARIHPAGDPGRALGNGLRGLRAHHRRPSQEHTRKRWATIGRSALYRDRPRRGLPLHRGSAREAQAAALPLLPGGHRPGLPYLHSPGEVGHGAALIPRLPARRR